MAGMLNKNLDQPQLANQPRERCGTWPRPTLDVPVTGMRVRNLDPTQEQRDTMSLLDSSTMTVGTQDSVMWPRSEVDISVPLGETTSQDAGVLEPFPEDYLNNLSPSAMTYGMPSFLNTIDLPNADFPNSTSHLTNLTTLKEETQQTDNTNDFSKSPPSTTVASSQSSTPSTSRASSKTKSTRKNAWGNMSYADLITQAIESSPEKRLTLAQIYEWMVKNIPYFKDKGDSNSSAGWKNSIRHNLSLHAKFKRIQNEGTGKSSWWVVNYDAKVEKTPRRRAVSVDAAHAKSLNSKRIAAKKKAELLKKQKSLKAHESGGGYGSENALGSTIGESLMPEFRDRSASHASYMTSSYSANREAESSYIGLNRGPLHKSLESVQEGTSLSMASKQGGTLLDPPRNQNCLPAIEGLSLSADRPMVFGQMPQPEDNKSSVYLQIQSNTNRKNMESITSSPNLASLLKSEKSPMKSTQTPMPKLEPRFQVNGEQEPMVQQYSQMMPMRTSTQYEAPMQRQNMNNGQDYSYPCQGMPMDEQYAQRQRQMQTEVPQQSQMSYIPNPQYPGHMIDPLEQQYLGQDMMADFSDLDPTLLYNPADTIDINTLLWNDGSHNMTFDGNADGAIGYSTSAPNTGLGNYPIPNNNNNPVPPIQTNMHPDPDIFINNPGPGATSADMMRDRCRMNMNNAPFQHIQPGQTSSVGGSQNYNMS